ncbi:low molecular weight protein-tyrosine-phosphatase [Croceitalea vernalis]|uniref:protein-tyrosine-phosphatase n=1 Tax=Croceitalea vernalis TaxID=3075599 RepID=A0ABU3BI53_9FLAO|nr:low molecular weight protein-tyrosine-phosphatase [Croceitalea sp. P007]MDT0621819.1 low molecular weight protein-tyrosine-phosphatase [Croceitalea sp. P007]
MIRVLMVCLGNICRSPLAEGILRSKVNDNKVIVDSAGTAGYHIGKHPDKRSIAIAQEYGIDISQQKCRKFIPSDFDAFDLIYVMDKSNYADILDQIRTENDIKKVDLLLHDTSSALQEVPDPYYGGLDGFENIYHMINEACEVIARKLENNEG